MGGQPGKPKPIGNPPIRYEPQRGFDAGGAGGPSAVRAILDNPPIHIRPDLPAARVQNKQTLWVLLHLVTAPEDFELLRGKDSLIAYTFGTGWPNTHSARIAACTPFMCRALSPTRLRSTRAVSTASTGRA
jgi:hypothetical protein